MNHITNQKVARRGAASAGAFLSIVMMVRNTRHEAIRTIQSLASDYQQDIDLDAYELCIVESHASEPFTPLDAGAFTGRLAYRQIAATESADTCVIDAGIRHARGNIVCLLADGACVATPGILSMAMTVFRTFDNPIVLVRDFFFQPDKKHVVDRTREASDAEQLLEMIGWPAEGYRLFEISGPLATTEKRPTWLEELTECRCVFLHKSTLERLGGAAAGYSVSEPNFLPPDFLRQAAVLEDSEVVQLIGEGLFHELPAGTTMSSLARERQEKLQQYRKRHRDLYGEAFTLPSEPPYVFGHMPNIYASVKMNGK